MSLWRDTPKYLAESDKVKMEIPTFSNRSMKSTDAFLFNLRLAVYSNNDLKTNFAQ